jgi:hypothetical protein
MPNPSTLAADLEAELAEQHELLRNAKSKRGKGIILRRIREIEAELGIESQPYNSNGFGKQVPAEPPVAVDEIKRFDDLKQHLANTVRERAEALGWYKRDGGFTKQGLDEGLSYLIGAHTALTWLGEAGIGNLIFVASVRGVDEVLGIKRQREPDYVGKPFKATGRNE